MLSALLCTLCIKYCYLRNLHEYSRYIVINKCEVDREFNTNEFNLSHIPCSRNRSMAITIILMKHHANTCLWVRIFVCVWVCEYACVCAYECIKNNSIRDSFPLKQNPRARVHNTTQHNAKPYTRSIYICMRLIQMFRFEPIPKHKCNIKSILIRKSCASDVYTLNWSCTM